LIAGTIALRDTELQIPSSGLSGVEAIPDLRHIREPGPVRATRARAGLLGSADGGEGRADVRAYGLDLTISAPNRVFLRGRGLDAELGGSLRLRGNTATVIPEGGLNLIRGRLDILGKRLVLSEAQVQLQGDFVPFIRIAASTESDGITSSVLIEGLANDPKVSFTSSPELPQEEVLSRLLFDRGLETLSAFQAAQLASAVASLAGKGGEGIVAKLRKGFGLDDLDVRTDEEGTASLRAGKYISRNVYSEIEVDQDGKSQIQLNLDVTDSITLRGRASADGTTGIGIVLEKDY
jgi:translocation and assembly module TamB